jgi:cob(I)alamin adenosyltransferase
MPRLTKLYTRKGDDGTTALGGGQRVAKDHIRVEAYGTVDELNSQLGVALTLGLEPLLQDALPEIQNELFHLGSDLCFIEADKLEYKLPELKAHHVEKLEKITDDLTEITGPLQNFILPGGSPGAASLHLARTICRRAERICTTLVAQESVGKYVLAYLNRLSDALFAMARFENHGKGIDEPLWDSWA